MVLAWTQPTQTTDRQNIQRAGVTRICRAVGEFPMGACREVVKELGPTEMISLPAVGGQKPRVVFEDVLTPGVVQSHRYAGYAIEVFNARGKSAGLSNQVRISLAPTLPAPADLRASVTSSGPVLHWTGTPAAQLVGSLHAYAYRYRIYRRFAGQQNYVVLGDIPLNGPQYATPDHSFEWERSYEYKVAAVTEIPGGDGRPSTEIEGDDSPIAAATVHDIFPPQRPSGLQAVFGGAGRKPFIDLSWAPNTESDLAGYTVYRHEAGQPPVALNKELAKAPTFRDENVEVGHTYSYSIQAVDERGNPSDTSEETSETVPQQ